jgi:hypothetical protein
MTRSELGKKTVFAETVREDLIQNCPTRRAAGNIWMTKGPEGPL